VVEASCNPGLLPLCLLPKASKRGIPIMGGWFKGPGGFELGAVVATPGTREAFSGSYLASCVTRHASGDWGDLTEEERRLNDLALEEGGGLVSFYRDSEGERGLYIITTAARSKTTILSSEEYGGRQ
jgi:hypothetical protein